MRWRLLTWRGWQSRLGLSLVMALVLAALGLFITLGPLGIRPALAAPITDSTCTPASYAADLIAAGTNGTIVFNCAAPADILVGSTTTISSGTTLTIRSIGRPVSLDGNHTQQVFVVDAGGKLTLERLTITGGGLGPNGEVWRTSGSSSSGVAPSPTTPFRWAPVGEWRV
jgi:hypothetical protein